MDDSVIDKVLDLIGDDDYLNFFGGEPLLYGKRIAETIDRLDAMGKDTKIKIFTNGSFIVPELMEVLKRTPRYIMLQVSYDGTRQEDVHGLGKITLNTIEQNILKYVEVMNEGSAAGKRDFHIEMTATPDTIEGSADGVEKMISLGVKSLGMVPVIEVEGGWSQDDAVRYTEEYRRIKDMVVASYEREDPIFVSHLSPFRSTNQDQHGCGAGKHLVALSPEGDIWWCHRYYALDKDNEDSRFKIGSIFDVNNLKDLEESLNVPVPLNKTSNCYTCEARQHCSKCHLANLVINGDEFQSPTNGYCQMPAVHKKVYEEMQTELLANQNQSFLNELYYLFEAAVDGKSEQCGICNPHDATIEEVMELAGKVNTTYL
jgi:uncharacterized protein